MTAPLTWSDDPGLQGPTIRRAPVPQGSIRLRGVCIEIDGMGQDGQAILAECEKIRNGVDRLALDALALVSPILSFAVRTSGVLRKTRLEWEPGVADADDLRDLLKESKFDSKMHDLPQVAQLARRVTYIEE